MSRQDELLAMSAQQATQQALKSIQDDAATTTAAYQQAVANGDTQNAAWQLRSLAALTEEYERIATAMTGQQRQQQAQQQPQQGGLNEWQIGFLQRHPEYANDPRKFSEIYASHFALVNRGLDPNSVQYAQALELSAGKPLIDQDTPLTADEVCQITGVAPDTYNKGAQDLLTLKSMGHYRDGR